jgi:formylglycine-generating enzyme required for sulfatase activity
MKSPLGLAQPQDAEQNRAPKLDAPGITPATEVMIDESRSLEDARGMWRALVATGMDRFEALAVVAQGDPFCTAHLMLEALWLVDIPTGTFLMGSPMDDPGRHGNEEPQRPVILGRPFRMMAVPLTQGAWEVVMGDKLSRLRGDPRLPVDKVSWQDVCAPDRFLARLNALTQGLRPEGVVFRLPSEAEWEYACRAGSTTAYPWGNDAAAMTDHGWASDVGGCGLHPVGLKRANAWGLHDLYGNVWEWCEDTWHDTYHGAPKDGSAWTQGGNAVRRVLRGGSGYSGTDHARSAFRYGRCATARLNHVGVRLVLGFPRGPA